MSIDTEMTNMIVNMLNSDDPDHVSDCGPNGAPLRGKEPRMDNVISNTKRTGNTGTRARFCHLIKRSKTDDFAKIADSLTVELSSDDDNVSGFVPAGVPNTVPGRVPSGVPDRALNGDASGDRCRRSYCDPDRFPMQEFSMKNIFTNTGATITTNSIGKMFSTDRVPYRSARHEPMQIPNRVRGSAPRRLPVKKRSMKNASTNTEETDTAITTNRLSPGQVLDRVPDRHPDGLPLQELSMKNVFVNTEETETGNTMNGSSPGQDLDRVPARYPLQELSIKHVFTTNIETEMTNTLNKPSPSQGLDRVPHHAPNRAPNWIHRQERSMRNIFANTIEREVTNTLNWSSSNQDPGRVPHQVPDRVPHHAPDRVPAQIRMNWENHKEREMADSVVNVPSPDYVSNRLPTQEQTLNFTNTEETEMTNLIVNMSSRLYGLDIEDIRRVAYEYAEALNLPKTFPSTYYGEKAGAQWAIGFTIRNRPLQNLDKNYAADSTEKALMEAFFRKLRTIRRKRKISSDRIYNTEVYAMNLTKRTEIVDMRGRNIQLVFSKAKNFASFQVCVNAKGEFMPPKLIFPVKNPAAPLVLPYKGTSELEHYGLITATIFQKWFYEFFLFSRPTEENPVLLLLDARFEYLRTFQFFQKAKQRHVEILCFPPNTSHILQPLDVSFFAPMREYYAIAVQEYFNFQPMDLVEPSDGQWDATTLENLASLFTVSYVRAATEEIGMDGFRFTGIDPFDPQQSILNFGGNACTQTPAHSVEMNEEDTDEEFEGEIATFAAKRFGLRK